MSSDINGILIVDKDKGKTSHNVVSLVRKRFSIKKVGHAGTLDPNATGVLVLLLGKATKLSSELLNEDKEYIATMRLGEKTDSGEPLIPEYTRFISSLKRGRFQREAVILAARLLPHPEIPIARNPLGFAKPYSLASFENALSLFLSQSFRLSRPPRSPRVKRCG